ncbi:penicillin-binding protein 1B [Photobacterium aphoticum]|uniref:Penicillin-binding protein 1B n=1 Tax=Photobacterium aphoticum TaxID=754436 RepID=A0A090QI39_9GAMM|nr:penicillin-binding protein 1B [Photobacterium aphoticum]KLV01769.1 peptidase [Photobacterium aphoticum]PSU58747.1 penicillin-binding protein 1B [Photobacterium aphoticum]GAL02576.1 multimodular transpeptidase-transglycosylase [Photobacterium aphoticum]GHA32284.1 penicillin-binding protein 1B [Photobacterium aphoticum]
MSKQHTPNESEQKQANVAENHTTTPSSDTAKTPRKKRRVPKWVKYTCLIGVLVTGAGLTKMGFDLNQEITDKFEGQLWQLPSVVYARELTLQPGAMIRYEDLISELKVLKYRKVNKPTQPGEYSTSRLKVEFIRRPFEFRDGPQEARHVIAQFDYSKVKRIIDAESNKELGYVSVEPKMLGMLEAKTDEQRIYRPMDEMPQPLIDALIATEDRDFYQHDGISPTAIARAFIANLKAGKTVQGGSTLTQQLAKNMFLSSERSLWRKFREAYMALIIDYRYSKDQILDAYLNQVYLAQSGRDAVHGFELGARFYFGLPLTELRVDQQALLVGLVKGPSYYNPWRYPERAEHRRDLVLKLMMENGALDKFDYKKAIKQDLGLQAKGQISNRQPAYFGQLEREVENKVRGYEAGQGLRLFTTLDPRSQAMVEQSVKKVIPTLEAKAGNELETAVVVADRMTGEIRAIVGGSRPSYDGFNRAVDAKRQIGSVVKPAIYLAALEMPERFSLATSLQDQPLTIRGENGEKWSPRNYDRKYRGEVPLYRALAKSYNIPTVNLGMAVGLDTVIDTMGRLGINENEIPKLPSMLLGAFTLTPLEVTQMYQTIANGGNRSELTALSAVVDKDGKILYQHLPTSSEMVSPQAAWLTMFTLQKVVTEGTGRYLNSVLPSSRLAGKTGTSDQGRDSWYVGVDGREVVTIWMGRDDNKAVKLTGSSGPLRLYTDYVQHRDPEPLVLPVPSHVVDFEYYRDQRGVLAQSCTGNMYLPTWDPNNNLREGCMIEPVEQVQRGVKTVEKGVKEGVEQVGGFFKKLFDW